MMMRATAAVQLNLDASTENGDIDGYRARWQLAHRLDPVLVAAFANSPLWHGKPTGWRSTRQAVWEHLDPSRTRSPQGLPPNADLRDDWSRFALDAGLLCVRRTAPADWTAPPGHSFASWLQGGITERPATQADLDYHLSTLFPPVRARGWLKLRMIDAQPGDGWIVPALLTTVLLDDRTAALARADVPAPLREAVAAFAERYPARGRCPADDLLDDRAAGRPAHPEGLLR
jgi:glutamate--cysteine ligase